ncbi:hypothetical protein ACLBXM_10670 [Xanthobacteraceae bacterium A53D]
MTTSDSSRADRFCAVILMLGALFGLYQAVVLSDPLWRVGDNGPLARVIMGFIYVCAIVSGGLLWRGVALGRLSAMALFAAQVPVVEFGGVAFHWFTGVEMVLAFAFTDSGLLPRFNLQTGAGALIRWDGAQPGQMFGINLFALGALAVLRARHRTTG